MIRKHEFNSNWWGQSVGIVENPAFFDQSTAIQHSMLNQFDWVEFRNNAKSSREILTKICQAGFVYVDTQINFKIALRKKESNSNTKTLTVRSSKEHPFELSVQNVAGFEHERFSYLPDITKTWVNQRYVQWANLLIRQSPQWSLEILDGEKVQGWFFSQTSDKGLNLTLAMLHRQASISGLLLYEKAIAAYADLGARIGWAGFSVYNTNVMNIYSFLGARFLEPSTCWLWINNVKNRHDKTRT